MKLLKLSALLFGLTLFGAAALQPVLAQAQPGGERAIDEDQQKMQTRMETMRQQMAEIEATSDPEERRRLLDAHMRQMHEAMTMMSKDVMPAAKRRMHTHKHTPATGKLVTGEPTQSEEHMKKMEQMMSHMEALMEQMSKHQDALADNEG